MIPKIIHYCWFGKGLMPQTQQDYIKHWQEVMPDWTIMRHDESTFDINMCPYTAEAYRQKKYAFVSDVARIVALQKYGGIYMDTDVEVVSSLEPLRDNSFFSGIEVYHDLHDPIRDQYVDAEGLPKEGVAGVPWLGVLSAIIGSEPNHIFLQEIMDEYKNRSALNDKGELNSVVIDGLLAYKALKYGFRYNDEEQDLGTIHLYTKEVLSYTFVPRTNQTIIIHHTAQSWKPKTRKEKMFILADKLHILKPYRKIKRKIKRS